MLYFAVGFSHRFLKSNNIISLAQFGLHGLSFDLEGGNQSIQMGQSWYYPSCCCGNIGSLPW